MDKEFSFSIDNCILNVFSSKTINELQTKYQFNKYYYLKQIHSNIVHIAGDNYINNQEGDALITNLVNTPLVVNAADCIPIVLYDKENKVIAAIHSGWKGTLNNITNKCLKLMMKYFDSKPKNISAYLYPSIRICHFEIEKDVFKQFENKIENITNYVIKKEPKYYLDLQKIVKDNLKKLGIININDSNICTYCNHDNYYSYRYNRTKNRNHLIVMIKE